MKIIIYALLVIIPVAALSVVTYTGVKAALAGGSRRRILVRNAAVFFAALVLVSGLALFAGATDAAELADTETAETAETADAGSGGITDKGLGLIAAALVTSLAGIGGGIAVAAGAPAAIAAASENASSFGKSLIFVALGESIALYGVVISILILNTI
ncbi:MAG: hypothetical protein K6G90_08780 [Clostridia bacterium]|nr:hypothetical protein [Clostridia bacterium]